MRWFSYSMGSVPAFVLEALAEFMALFLLTLLRREWLAAAAFVLILTTFAVLFLGTFAWFVISRAPWNMS